VVGVIHTLAREDHMATLGDWNKMMSSTEESLEADEDIGVAC
jgi:hypothetical protein